MKKIIILLFVLSSFQSYAQYSTTQDSVGLFYDSLIYHLKSRYLFRDSVNWGAVESIKAQALNAGSFGESLAFSTALFDTIDGSHLNLFSDYGWYKGTPGREYVQEDFHINFLLKYEQQPDFEVQVINGQYGYILMPSMLMIDLPQDSINLETQRMYDEIMKVNAAHELKGWIIDLRFNGGGNVFPMLAALYHFLGDGTLYHCVDQKNQKLSETTLNKGVIHDSEDGIDRATIVPSLAPDLKVPVACITSIITASAGELISVSFYGRDNVITIGEPTAGYTTANSLTELPFDTQLTLTTSYMADRQYQYRAIIEPEILVQKEANFEDLSQDKNIMEAIRYFDSLQ